MMWAIFPVFSQLFYVSSSYIQNFLTDCAMTKKSAGALTVMHIPYFLLGMFLLYAIFGRAVLVLPLAVAIGFIVSGAINVFGSLFCYKALQEGDAGDVVIFSQLSPLISLGLGVAVLHETITVSQGLGFIFIMAAVAVVVLGDRKKSNKAPDLRVVRLCLLSQFFSVLSDIVFVYFAKDFLSNTTFFAQSFFFFELGSALTAIILFICLSKYRKGIKTAFVKSKSRTRNNLAIIVDNLALLIGELLFKYGLLIVPVVAMMTAVSKVTSLFVSLFFTVFIGRLFPKFIHGKRITKRVLLHYLISAIFIVTGILIMT